MKWLAVFLTLLGLGLALGWPQFSQLAADSWRRHGTPRLQQPEGWPRPVYDFSGNPLSRAGFELGRALFYEPKLSRDDSIACANCHQQFVAFANAGHRLSHGVNNALGTRNAPALFNLAWQPSFMWDGGVHPLEVQPLGPISNPVEMAETLAGVVRKLQDDPRYPPRFAAAFGSPRIDGQHVLLALTQFVATLQSADSPYDRYLAGRARFNAQEQRGLAVFRAQCASCHREPLFSDYSFRNNGLDAEPRDPGRAHITERAEDRGLFRVPSLRNIAVSGPYMHDGRFETLDAVLAHYAEGIVSSATLDPALRQGLKLDAADRAALRAFLDTLTDERFLHDPRFADPGEDS